MKLRQLLLLVLLTTGLSYTARAQQTAALPHGMVFGSKPDTANAMPAAALKLFMGNKKRISTVLTGKVVRVIHQKGGWFELDAGNNKTIPGYFKDYAVTLPAAIKGRLVIIQCVAKKKFLADDRQHFAGDTVTYKADPELPLNISLEVYGLMVYQ